MRKSWFSPAWLLMGLSACIIRLDGNVVKPGATFLVVEAEFSDVAGGQKVQLSRSANGADAAFSRPITDATVYVQDDQNRRINFTSVGGGQYQTSLAGQVGRAYTLFIQLADGKRYRSVAEPLKPCPAIDNLSYEFVEEPKFSDSRRYGYNVYLDLTDEAATDDFYQWTWTHYQRLTYCAVCPNGVYDKQNERCVTSADAQGKTYQYTCETDCWTVRQSTALNLLADVNYRGKPIRRVLIDRVPYASPPSRYYLRVGQRNLNARAFNYLKALKEQGQTNGTLFDVPAQTQFNFNITSETDPNERIIGIFNVFSQRQQVIYVQRTPVSGLTQQSTLTPGEAPPVPPAPPAAKCNELTSPPPGWVD